MPPRDPGPGQNAKVVDVPVTFAVMLFCIGMAAGSLLATAVFILAHIR